MSPRTEAQRQATHDRCHSSGNLAAKEALSADIAASGLSVRQYARVILKRPARTVFRWIGLKSPIPNTVRDLLTPASTLPLDKQATSK